MAWPGSLPEYLPIETQESADDNVVKTEMDMGPRKVRRRFTALVRFLDPPPDRYIFTEAQKDTLLTFHDTTLKHGSLSFNWVSNGPTKEFDGVTTATSFRFDGRPEVKLIVTGASSATRLYQVSMRLEILP